MRWAALDFETATRSGASACALGVVVVEDGVERYRQAWLIRPPYNAYHWSNVRVHGISPDMTQDAPEFPEVWDEAMEMMGDLTMVAHNAAFDVGVIRGCCELYGMAPPTSPYLCTVQMSRRTWKDLPNHKLPTVAAHVGAELVHHDALSDAAACSAILRACIDEAGARSVDELIGHHAIKSRHVHAV
ncbi:MAG: exonuclease [Thermoleophilia bacterium]|nr:exonuclease [Thermoleophilia bacterium]